MKAKLMEFHGDVYKVELVAESDGEKAQLNKLYEAVSGRKEMLRFAGASVFPEKRETSKIEFVVK